MSFTLATFFPSLGKKEKKEKKKRRKEIKLMNTFERKVGDSPRDEPVKNSKALVARLRGSDKVHLARRHGGIMQKRILFSV